MRTLFREELAEPLDTDGFHLGRPPAGSPTRAAQIIMPQDVAANPVLTYAMHKIANQFSGGFRSMYFPGVLATVQGDTPCWTPKSPPPTGW